MDLLDIWAITTITNFFYRIKTNIATYKAYADLGYIYNAKRFKNIEDQDMEEDTLVNWFFYKFGKFIPIYNLLQSLERKFRYCINAKENIDILEEYQIIEKMTTKEKEEYNKKKTGIYALKMRRKLNKKQKKYDCVVLTDGSSILYDYIYDNLDKEEELLGNIKIIEARGNIENASNEELIKIVYGSHISMGIGVLNTYDDPETLTSNYKEKDKIELVLEDTPSQSHIEKNNVKKKIRKR